MSGENAQNTPWLAIGLTALAALGSFMFAPSLIIGLGIVAAALFTGAALDMSDTGKGIKDAFNKTITPPPPEPLSAPDLASKTLKYGAENPQIAIPLLGTLALTGGALPAVGWMATRATAGWAKNKIFPKRDPDFDQQVRKNPSKFADLVTEYVKQHKATGSPDKANISRMMQLWDHPKLRQVLKLAQVEEAEFKTVVAKQLSEMDGEFRGMEVGDIINDIDRGVKKGGIFARMYQGVTKPVSYAYNKTAGGIAWINEKTTRTVNVTQDNDAKIAAEIDGVTIGSADLNYAKLYKTQNVAGEVTVHIEGNGHSLDNMVADLKKLNIHHEVTASADGKVTGLHFAETDLPKIVEHNKLTYTRVDIAAKNAKTYQGTDLQHSDSPKARRTPTAPAAADVGSVPRQNGAGSVASAVTLMGGAHALANGTGDALNASAAATNLAHGLSEFAANSAIAGKLAPALSTRAASSLLRLGAPVNLLGVTNDVRFAANSFAAGQYLDGTAHSLSAMGGTANAGVYAVSTKTGQALATKAFGQMTASKMAGALAKRALFIAAITTAYDSYKLGKEVYGVTQDNAAAIRQLRALEAAGITDEYKRKAPDVLLQAAIPEYVASGPIIAEYKHLSQGVDIAAGVLGSKHSELENLKPEAMVQELEKAKAKLEAEKQLAVLASTGMKKDASTWSIVTSIFKNDILRKLNPLNGSMISPINSMAGDMLLAQTNQGRLALESQAHIANYYNPNYANVIKDKVVQLSAIDEIDGKIASLEAAKKELLGDTQGHVNGNPLMLSFKKRLELQEAHIAAVHAANAEPSLATDIKQQQSFRAEQLSNDKTKRMFELQTTEEMRQIAKLSELYQEALSRQPENDALKKKSQEIELLALVIDNALIQQIANEPSLLVDRSANEPIAQSLPNNALAQTRQQVNN